MWLYIGMIVALAVGIYIGLGMPGLPGAENRVVPGGSPRRRRAQKRSLMVLDWLRSPRRR